MKVVANLDEKYVPMWNKNRSLPEADQVVVQIKWPTNAQREMLKGYRINPKTSEVTVWFDTDTILRRHIGTITNLDLNGKPIKTGEALADGPPALGGLIDELKAYVCSEDGIEDGEEKN